MLLDKNVYKYKLFHLAKYNVHKINKNYLQ